jgi:hypothetical protein
MLATMPFEIYVGAAEWRALCFGRFIPEETDPDTHWARHWLDTQCRVSCGGKEKT